MKIKNKRGILGIGITTLIATIAIVIILIVFVVTSSILRKVEGHSGKIVILKGDKIGLGDVKEYLEVDYKAHCKLRSDIGLRSSLSRLAGEGDG